MLLLVVYYELQAATLPDELKDLEDAVVIPVITNDNRDSLKLLSKQTVENVNIQPISLGQLDDPIEPETPVEIPSLALPVVNNETVLLLPENTTLEGATDIINLLPVDENVTVLHWRC